MEAVNNNERRWTFERELINSYLIQALPLPAQWLIEDNFLKLEVGQTTVITIHGIGMITPNDFPFRVTRYNDIKTSSDYKVIFEYGWGDYILQRGLQARDRIIIEVTVSIDLNQEHGDGFQRDYIVWAQGRNVVN